MPSQHTGRDGLVEGRDLVNRRVQEPTLWVGLQPRRGKQGGLNKPRELRCGPVPIEKSACAIKREISLRTLEHRAVWHQARVACCAGKGPDFNPPFLPDRVTITWQCAVIRGKSKRVKK